MNGKRLLSLFLIASFLLTPLLSTSTIPVSAQTEAYPVPRDQAVILETDTSFTNFDSANHLIPLGDQWGSGWHQVVEEWDWYINYATGEIIYWRITGWDYNEDYTTFTIHIREGVTWNDGHPYTADDYVFTTNMLLENTQLLGSSYVVEWVESVEAVDDYTVVYNLNKPNPRFHQSFRMWGQNIGRQRPEHIWEDEDPMEFKNWPPVETGPYKLHSVYPDLLMFIWERREDYWAKDLGYFPAPKYVIGRYAPPADIMLADFVAGMVDAPLPHLFGWDTILAAMAQTENITIAPFLDPCPLGIAAFNFDRYPLNVLEMRWAIAYCLNREKLGYLYPMADGADVSPYPWALPQYGWVNQYAPMVERAMEAIENELGFKYEYNPDKAKEILDSIDFIDRNGDGWRETPNGTVLTFELMSRPQTVIQEYYIAADLAEELRNIGIDASVRTIDPGLMGENGQLGTYDIYVGSLCGEWTMGDLVGTLDLYHSKWYAPIGTRAVGGGIHGFNLRYRNARLDEITDQLWAIGPDAPGAAELYEEAIHIITRDMLGAPAVEKMFVQTFSTSYWTGWPSEDYMYHVPYIWWPEFIFVLFQIKPVKEPAPTVTTVTETATVTETTATTVATTVTETVATMDMTTVAGAGVVALIVGVVVGWLVGSRKS